MTKYLTRCELREEGLFCLQCWGRISYAEEVPAGVRCCWSQCVQRREAERNGHPASPLSLCCPVRMVAREPCCPPLPWASALQLNFPGTAFQTQPGAILVDKNQVDTCQVDTLLPSCANHHTHLSLSTTFVDHSFKVCEEIGFLLGFSSRGGVNALCSVLPVMS